MKKAITTYVWLQVILTAFGAAWALMSPNSYGKWLGRTIEPMMKVFGFVDEEDEK